MAIENISDLEKSLRLPEGTIKTAIESAEPIKVEIPDLKIFTNEEDEARINNLKTQFHTAGREIAIKTAREQHGLDFQGKTIDNLLDSYKAKVLAEAKVEPNTKIEELMQDNGKLKSNIATLEQTLETTKKSIQIENQSRLINEKISSSITGELILPKEDIITIFKSKYATEITDDNKVVFKKDGEVLKNERTLDPLGVEDVMKGFLTPYIKGATGGAGAGDNTGGAGQSNLQKFNKEMESKSIKVGSSDYNREMQKRISDKTLVI